MEAPEISTLFPTGFPVIPFGPLSEIPNPLVQLYVEQWKMGKISLEIALCSAIHCLHKHNEALQEFIANPPKAEPTVVNINEKQDNENPCQPICNKEEQQASEVVTQGACTDGEARKE